MVSIVIPVLDDATLIGGCLDRLEDLPPRHEVIVVDGGSKDGTQEQVARRPWAVLVRSRAGRGIQMNAGVAVARHQTLLFLHCDVRLPPDALEQVERAMEWPDVAGGGFLKAYGEAGRLPAPAGAAFLLSALEWGLNHVRTRLLGHLVGSNAMFMRSSVFARLGGFRDWPLLEDVDMSDRLRQHGRIVVLDGPVEVSARRYLRDGTLKRILLNARIMAGYRLLGQAPTELEPMYRRDNRPAPETSRSLLHAVDPASTCEPCTGPAISVIVPTLDEEAVLGRCLRSLEGLPGVEVIVADGGSTDGTWKLAQLYPGVKFLLCAERGRAVQMNAGAGAASGDILAFLHADTELPEGAFERMRETLFPRSGAAPSAGAFDIEFDAEGWKYRVIERLSNWRNRLARIPYGDQCLFLRREVFESLGGFPRQPFLEDIAMARALGQLGRIVFLPELRVRTSARRYRIHGPLKTAVRNAAIAALFCLGVPAGWLRASYQREQSRVPAESEEAGVSAQPRRRTKPADSRWRASFLDLAAGIAVFSVALALRTAFLDADPPASALGRIGATQISGDLLTDEGWYSRNARLHALTGQWSQPDDLNPIAISPVFSVLQRLAFGAFGVSLLSARLGPALLGAMAPVVLFLLLSRPLGRPFAAAAGMLLAIDFPSVMYSRLALTEIPYIALITASIAILLAARRRASRNLVSLSALVAVLATGVKLSAASIAAAVLADAMFVASVLGFRYGDDKSVSPARMAMAWAATYVAAMTFCVLVWLPFFGEESAYLTGRLMAERLGGPVAVVAAWGVFVRDGVPWRHWPVLFPVGAMYGVYALQRAWRDSRGHRDQTDAWRELDTPGVEVRLLTLWLISATGGLASLSYQPVRYHLILAVPLSGLFAAALELAFRRGSAAKVAAGALFCAAVLHSTLSYVAWAERRQCSATDAAAKVASALRKESSRPVLCGRIADTLALENHLPTVNLPIGRPVEDIGERLRRYRPTHLLLLRSGELSTLARRYPETFDSAVAIASIDVLGNYYTGEPARLYRLVDSRLVPRQIGGQ